MINHVTVYKNHKDLYNKLEEIKSKYSSCSRAMKVEHTYYIITNE